MGRNDRSLSWGASLALISAPRSEAEKHRVGRGDVHVYRSEVSDRMMEGGHGREDMRGGSGPQIFVPRDDGAASEKLRKSMIRFMKRGSMLLI